MLDRRDHGVEPTEPPMVEVDWREWWFAIDKRVQEHLAAERETLVKSLDKALAMERRRLRENADEFRGPPGRPRSLRRRGAASAALNPEVVSRLSDDPRP